MYTDVYNRHTNSDTYTHMCAHTHIWYIYACTHTYLYTSGVQIHTCTHTCLYTCVHVHTHVLMFINSHMYTHALIFTYAHTNYHHPKTCKSNMSIHMHARTHVYTYAYTHTRIYTYAHTQTFVHIHTHITSIRKSGGVWHIQKRQRTDTISQKSVLQSFHLVNSGANGPLRICTFAFDWQLGEKSCF